MLKVHTFRQSVIFFFLKALDKARCLFPKGILNGRCVDCPVDTLYEYVPLILYRKNGDGYSWHPPIRIDKSYHKCTNMCSQNNPIIASGRQCTSRCSSKILNRANIIYCPDASINNGFCEYKTCLNFELKCYYMQCFKDCPSFTVGYNNSCVMECFEDKPFILQGRCVKQCPDNYFIDGNICQNECSPGRYISNRTCLDECPKSEQFIHKQNCVAQCPNKSLVQDGFCVQQCSANYVVNGKICLKKCPTDRYEHDGKCITTCPIDTLIENRKCVKNCSVDLFKTDYRCVTTCPPSQYVNITEKVCVKHCDGLKYRNNSEDFCLQECPDGTSEYNSTCVARCPTSHPFFYSKKCVAECPTSSRFVSKRAGQGSVIKYICVDKCAKYVSFYSNTCVDACSSNEILYDNVCQLACPLSDPYHVHLPATLEEDINLTTSFNITKPINAFAICTKECPSTFVSSNAEFECYSECPSSTENVIFNSSCLQKCPDNHSLLMIKNGRNICTKSCEKFQFQKTCLEICPATHASVQGNECVNCSQIGKFEENKKCVNKCEIVSFENRCYNTCPPNARYMFNGTCVESCPTEAPMANEQHYGPYSLEVCTNQCPKEKFVFDNRCVSTCPENKRLPLDGRCVSCHEVGKYDHGSKCVDLCPNLHYNFRCVEGCPWSFQIFNKTCVLHCPFNAPLRYQIGNEYHCVNKCQNGTYLFKNECVAICNDQLFYFERKCIEKCPITAPFISKFTSIYGINSRECLPQCKPSQFSLNFTCFETCPDGYVGYNQNCLRSCPIDSPYIYHKVCVQRCKTLRQGTNCYDNCPKGTFQNDKTCVQTCPSTKPIHYKNRCVRICQSYLINEDCFDECPFGLFGYKKKCLLRCPSEAYNTYKWECFAKCPNKTIFNSTQHACLDSCPKGMLRFGQKCFDKCPSQAMYISNGECVKNCSSYLDGLHCLKKCPPGKYNFKRKCIEKCPVDASFVSNRTCLVSCPLVHDDYGNCMQKCPKNTYPHGKQCKSECPPNLPFLRTVFLDNECRESCYNYFELAAENNTCIDKSACSGFIDDIWCRQTCLKHSYVLRTTDEKHCKSLKPVYVMLVVILAILIFNSFFVIRLMCHCYYIRARQVRFFIFLYRNVIFI